MPLINKFKFYETPSWVSNLIADTLKINNRAQILDLGAGKGSLLKALKKKYPKARYDSIEINRNFEEDLKPISSNICWLDLSINKIPKDLVKKNTQLTIISNPPFGKVSISKEELRNLKDRYLIGNKTRTLNSRLELIFIARALEVAKKGSNIAFIVPNSFIDNERYFKIRDTLVKKHGLYKVCKLSGKTFDGAEVSSSIIFLKPYSGSKTNILLEDYSGMSNVEIKTITAASFIDPLIDHYSENKINLGLYTTKIDRGISSSKVLKERKISHLHSTDLRNLHATEIDLDSSFLLLNYEKKERIAIEGDILIARVGTRCLGSTALVSSGSSVISDCVIIIRVNKSKRADIFKKLVSYKGQEWLKKYSTGSCAKILTYNTIQGFPMEFA